MNSTLKGPTETTSRGLTVSKTVEPTRSNSLNFSSMRPRVRVVAYIGAFISRSIKGSAPVWSSWPWVMKNAFTLSLFLLR